jgi:hypothetical protein
LTLLVNRTLHPLEPETSDTSLHHATELTTINPIFQQDLWLTFGGVNAPLEGFTDADYGGQPDSHSISGYAFIYGCGAITWSSKKQSVIATSSTEAEYLAGTHATKEAIWLQSFMGELEGTDPLQMRMRSDNQSAISLAHDNKFHARTKHIRIPYHFIRHAITSKDTVSNSCMYPQPKTLRTYSQRYSRGRNSSIWFAN